MKITILSDQVSFFETHMKIEYPCTAVKWFYLFFSPFACSYSLWVNNRFKLYLVENGLRNQTKLHHS